MATPETVPASVERRSSSLTISLSLAAILIGGLALRLWLSRYGVFQGDAQTFRQWALRLVSAPLPDFYSSARSADHLPGDLWFLWGIAHLYRWISPGMNVQGFGFLFLLKLVPSLADTGIALLVFLIARRFAGARAGLLGAALIMFNPALIFLSATWGQWDSVSACVTLIGLWLLLSGNPEWSLPVCTYAALIKPQLGLLLVLAGLSWWRWSIRPPEGVRPLEGGWRQRSTKLALGALASIGVFLLVDLPFSVGLPPLPTRWTIFERVSYALNRYTSISANAFNLWGVFGRWSNGTPGSDAQLFVAGMSYQHWGELLLGLAVLGSLVLFWLRPGRSMALWTALAITFALFMLPTRIHERYLMPAVVLAVLLAAVAPKLRWLGIALSLTYCANLVYVYHYDNRFGFGSGPNPNDLFPVVISAVNLFLFLVVLVAGVVLARGGLWRDLPVTASAIEAEPVRFGLPETAQTGPGGRPLGEGVS